MPLAVSYMGTKRQLAEPVSATVARCRPGPLLDVFSGLCVVASAVAPARQIWTNDLQYFAQAISLAYFCSITSPPTRFHAVACTFEAYSAHVHAHSALASNLIRQEETALGGENCQELNRIYANWRCGLSLNGWDGSQLRDATLFRDTFSGTYFSMSQAVEIDALRYAIDLALKKDLINLDEHRWMILALCVALSKCGTTTGHFAQPLTPKPNNIRRFVRQRSRSIKDAWIAAIEAFMPIGTAKWRRGNFAFRGDAVNKLKELHASAMSPAVVYADPPYTGDQYSRFYHIYDTLILYDYPAASGRGLYRPDRATSSFSILSTVRDSIESLVRACADLGADLIISYPVGGLLKESRDVIPTLINTFYGKGPEIQEISHEHSTMGGSKGAGKQAVTEVIYRACC
jgi:adenine-specific DNA-methyltransferase